MLSKEALNKSSLRGAKRRAHPANQFRAKHWIDSLALAMTARRINQRIPIDFSVIHDTYAYSYRHSGEGRKPGNYKSLRITSELAGVFWQPSRMASSYISVITPPITALPAMPSSLASWIPAFAGMTEWCFSDVDANYGNLNNRQVVLSAHPPLHGEGGGEDGVSQRIIAPCFRPHGTSVYAQYTVLVGNREAVQKKLNEAGIPTAVHYPIPLNLQPVFAHLDKPAGSFPVSEEMSKRVMSLPMGPDITPQDQDRIANALFAGIKLL